MKRNRTTIGVALTALLLVVGAGAVMATNGPARPSDAIVLAAGSPSASPAAGAKDAKPDKEDGVLTAVLDDLVAKGTITAAQRTAILDGVSAEKTARNEARKAARQQMKDFLADGQITQDELDKLPADSPLRQLTTLMDDGKITVDELRSVGKGMGKGLGIGNGKGWMKHMDDAGDDADDDASESPGS